MSEHDLVELMGMVGSIRPFDGKHHETGERLSVMVSADYVTIRSGKTSWHFIRETGQFDGYSTESR